MFWRLVIITFIIASPTCGSKLCDGWDCGNMAPSAKACDSWDCSGTPSGQKPCDSWDCGGSGGNAKVSRETPKNFIQILRLKCESLPYQAYWDAKTLTCVDIQPSGNKCMVLHFKKGKISLDGISNDLKTKLNALNMIAPTNAGTNSINCVWGNTLFYSHFTCSDFGLKCTNGTMVGDKCVEVVTKADTITNAARSCSKKGYRLYVPHDDLDVQQLLVHLSQYADPAFWIGVTAPSTSWIFDDSSIVDFFRWKTGRAQGGQLLSKPTDNVNIGYMDIQKSTVKAPFVCSRYLDSDYYYQGDIKTTPGKSTDSWDNQDVNIKDSWGSVSTDSKDGWGSARSSRY